MRLTTHNTFTDIVSIMLGVVFIGLAASSVVLVIAAAFRLIAGAFACAPSL